MKEIDVFGIAPPGRTDASFISVMGSLGTYRAISIYKTHEDLCLFWDIQDDGDSDDDDVTDRLFQINQLQAVFGKASELQPEDKEIIKQLGLTFADKQLIPHFRSMRPGYHPWFVDPEEADLLTIGLEQLIDIAPRVKADPLHIQHSLRDNRLLIRAPVNNQPDAAWHDTRHLFILPDRHISVAASQDLLQSVKQLPRNNLHLEVDLFFANFQIESEQSRPVMPLMLLMVDKNNYYVFGHELLVIESTRDHLLTTIPTHMFHVLLKHQFRPACITVKSLDLFRVLNDPCEDVGIRLTVSSHLPTLSKVRRDMTHMLKNR